MQHRTRSDVRLEVSVLRKLCERVDSPLSLGVALLLDNGQFLDVLEKSIDPRGYSCPDSFRKDYFIVSYLSKWKGWKIKGLDPKQKAISEWRLAEERCRIQNKKIKDFYDQILVSDYGPIYHRASRKIRDILGPLKMDKVLSLCRWGPGATLDLRRGCGLDNKISKKLSVTLRALPLLRTCVELDPNWIEAITGFYPSGPVSLLPSCYEIVRGGRLITVAKKATTDRVIIAEPTGNSFLQQGVGRYIRERLAIFGVDLNDQLVNRNLARRAFQERLATIDLKAASDTISYELVWDLLPYDWALLLTDLRSPSTRLPDGTYVPLEKFSSMGNAYTFELESLIFFALCEAMREVEGDDFETAVYGDDMIVSQHSAPKIVEILEDAGFTVNNTKSYLEGSFYESCGGHFFAGVDVTPVFQKEIVRPLHEIIRAANRLFRFDQSLTSRARRMYTKIWNHAIVPRIPFDSPDDGGFLSHLDTLGTYDRNHGYRCDVLVYSEKLRDGHQTSLLAYKLRHPTYQSSDPEGRGFIGTARGRYVFRKSWRHAGQQL